jgi:RNA polymerase sigma-70 factor (ECF subfamily)
MQKRNSKLSFADRVATHQPKLLAFARILTKNMREPEEAAKDLTQEIICKAIESADKFTSDGNLSGWLCTMMKNHFINEYRRGKKRPIVPIDKAPDMPIHEPTLNAMDAETVRKAVAELPKAAHAVALTLQMEGYLGKEIAEITGVPPGTVRTRVFHAKEILENNEALKELKK